MSYINKMYGRKAQIKTTTESEKNPNRVMGGLRAQGVDSYKILGEDGTEREIPTQRYVMNLEEKLRRQTDQIEGLNKKVNKLTRNYDTLTNHLKAKKD